MHWWIRDFKECVLSVTFNFTMNSWQPVTHALIVLGKHVYLNEFVTVNKPVTNSLINFLYQKFHEHTRVHLYRINDLQLQQPWRKRKEKQIISSLSSIWSMISSCRSPGKKKEGKNEEKKENIISPSFVLYRINDLHLQKPWKKTKRKNEKKNTWSAASRVHLYRINVFMHVCIYVCICIFVYAFMCVCMYTCIYMYIHVRIYTYYLVAAQSGRWYWSRLRPKR